MAKVLSGDLSSANNDNMATFEHVIDISSQIASKLSSFNSSSTSILVGGGYDAVRVKLSLYINVFNTLKTICSNLINNIKNANNSMLNYMEGYAELDDAKLPEIETKLKEILGYINYLASINGTTDGNGNVIDVTAEIAEYTAIYNELNHFRELLAGLASEDASLFGSLEGLIEDVSNMICCIKGINESTFTKEGMDAFKKGKGSIYKFNKNDNKFSFSGTSVLPKSKEYQQRAWEAEVVAYCQRMGFPVWYGFGGSGCGTCTAAEVYSNLLGREVTPCDIIYNVNKLYGKSKTTNSDDLFNKIAQEMGCYSRTMNCSKGNVINCLTRDGQVATVINGGAHYISIVDYDPKTDTFTIFDSYYTQNGSGYRKMTWDQFVSYRNGHGICYEIYKK